MPLAARAFALHGQDAMGVVVTPTTGMHMDTLAIAFPVVWPTARRCTRAWSP